jgi:cell division protease FtsH
MARKLVTAYGMSDAIGPVTLAEQSETVFLGRDFADHKNYSETVAATIDAEVARIMREQLVRATELLTAQRAYLDSVAKELIAKETLEQEEFHELVKAIIPESKKQSPEGHSERGAEAPTTEVASEPVAAQ